MSSPVSVHTMCLKHSLSILLVERGQMCFIIKYGGLSFLTPSRHWCRAMSLWRTAEGQIQSLSPSRSKSEGQSLWDWVPSLPSMFSFRYISSFWRLRRLVLLESCDLLPLRDPGVSTQLSLSPSSLCGTPLSFKSVSVISAWLFWFAASGDDGGGDSPTPFSSLLCTPDLAVAFEMQLHDKSPLELKWLWSSPWSSTGWWFVPQRMSIASCSSVGSGMAGGGCVSWDTSLSSFWCLSWAGGSASADGASPEAWAVPGRVGRMAWWHMGHVSCTYNHFRRQLPWKKCPQ